MSNLSPCIKVCKIDEKSGLCIGCYRSIKEISMWSKLNWDERYAVLDDIAFVRSQVYNFDV